MFTKYVIFHLTVIFFIGLRVAIALDVRDTAQISPIKIRPSVNNTEEEIRLGWRVLGSNICYKNARLANGRASNIWEYPWMALLMYSDGIVEIARCGGTLITDQYVLTAAHCLRLRPTSLVKVRLGEYDTAEDPDCNVHGRRRHCEYIQEIEAEEAVYHQDYSSDTSANDIGLVRLQRKANFGHNIRTICLPGYYKDAVFGQSFAAGWGALQTGLRSRVLQDAEVSFSNDTRDCQQSYPNKSITYKQICLIAANRSCSCKGDSGGPLFQSVIYRSVQAYIQHGILSYGGVDCGSSRPDVFTKVESYMPWIAGNIRP